MAFTAFLQLIINVRVDVSGWFNKYSYKLYSNMNQLQVLSKTVVFKILFGHRPVSYIYLKYQITSIKYLQNLNQYMDSSFQMK